MSITDRARAEAEKRWHPRKSDRLPIDWLDEGMASGFVLGAQWAASQEPTDEEMGHVYAEWMNHSPILDLDAHRINCSCGDRGFTPPGYELHRLRAGLSAARNARRDEEER